MDTQKQSRKREKNCLWLVSQRCSWCNKVNLQIFITIVEICSLTFSASNTMPLVYLPVCPLRLSNIWGRAIWLTHLCFPVLRTSHINKDTLDEITGFQDKNDSDSPKMIYKWPSFSTCLIIRNTNPNHSKITSYPLEWLQLKKKYKCWQGSVQFGPSLL